MMAPIAIPVPRGPIAPGAVTSPQSTPSPTAIRYNPAPSTRRRPLARPQNTPYDLFTERFSRDTAQYTEMGSEKSRYPSPSTRKARTKIQRPPWLSVSFSTLTRRSKRGQTSVKNGRSSRAKNYFLGERRPRDVSAGVMLLGSSIPISFYDHPPSVARGEYTNFRPRPRTPTPQSLRPPPKAKKTPPLTPMASLHISPRSLSDVSTVRVSSPDETPAVPKQKVTSLKKKTAVRRKLRAVPMPRRRRTPPASPTPPVPPPRPSRVGLTSRCTFRVGSRASQSINLNDSRWTTNEPWKPDVRRVLRWDASYYGPGRISFTGDSEESADDTGVKMPNFDAYEAGVRAHELRPDSSPEALKNMSAGARAKVDAMAVDNVRCVYISLDGKSVTLPAGKYTVGDVRFKATKVMECVWHEVILTTGTSTVLSDEDAPAPKVIYIQRTAQKKFGEAVWMNTVYQHTIRNDTQGLLLMPDKMKEQQIPRKRVMERVELQLRRDNGSEVIMPEEREVALQESVGFVSSAGAVEQTDELHWPAQQGSFDFGPSARGKEHTDGLQELSSQRSFDSSVSLSPGVQTDGRREPSPPKSFDSGASLSAGEQTNGVREPSMHVVV